MKPPPPLVSSKWRKAGPPEPGCWPLRPRRAKRSPTPRLPTQRAPSPTANASLGSLINSGLDSIQTHNIQLVWPTMMVALLMLCFTFLGDGLRDALDPRTRK
ncbi:MAG: hypothetical protein M9925_02065 [Chloroflexi bacterium]|nr:hypothetical protein [Chloroflexota bacterium]